MRAMVTPQFGPPDSFEERDVERPGPGPGEILVRVVAAGTNPIDSKFREDGSFAGLEPPVILGSDVSGVIEEVGEGIDDLAPGDEVYYTPEVFGPGSNGAYAEYHVVSADIVAMKPESISHEEAAAVPLAGGTAYEVIVRRLGLGVAETVLIQGAAGGVGSFAIQIAKAAGVRVLATAGPENQSTLKDLGADVAIDYTNQDVTQIALDDTGEEGVDATFDAVGGETVVNSIAATRAYGSIATILGGHGDFTPMYTRNQTLHGVLLAREQARLDEIALLIDRGQVKPLVDEVLDLTEVGKAHDRLDSGHGRGKVVLRVSSN